MAEKPGAAGIARNTIKLAQERFQVANLALVGFHALQSAAENACQGGVAVPASAAQCEVSDGLLVGAQVEGDYLLGWTQADWVASAPIRLVDFLRLVPSQLVSPVWF